MNRNTAVAGGVAGFVGLLLGILLAPSGADQEEMRQAVRDELAATVKATQGIDKRVADLGKGLGEAFDDMKSRLDKVEAAAGDAASDTGADLAALKSEMDAKLDTLGSRLGDALSAGAAAQTEAFEQHMSALKEAYAGLAHETTGTAAAASASAETVPGAAASAPPAAPGGLRAGETTVLDEGRLRVFVSRVMEEDQAARVAIDGALQTLKAGEKSMIRAGRSWCMLALGRIDGGRADITAACGDALPAPAGQSAGLTQAFEDGKLRVTVSRVDDALRQARLSVNGETVTLDQGRTARMGLDGQPCGVTLIGVDRGHAELSARCGPEMAVSDPVAPGSALSLGDGKARVFVSSVAGASARVAVNGTGMQMLDAGKVVDLGDGCAVTLEEVAAGKARFSYACAE